jgi:hypothetical protein
LGDIFFNKFERGWDEAVTAFEGFRKKTRGTSVGITGLGLPKQKDPKKTQKLPSG